MTLWVPKGCCPRCKKKNRTQPKDQTSLSGAAPWRMAAPYGRRMSSIVRRISGAIHTEKQVRWALLSTKSLSLNRTGGPDDSRMLSGLMSRWMMCCEWRYSRPDTNCTSPSSSDGTAPSYLFRCSSARKHCCSVALHNSST